MAPRARVDSVAEEGTARKSLKQSQENDATSARKLIHRTIYMILTHLRYEQVKLHLHNNVCMFDRTYTSFFHPSTLSVNTRPLRSNRGKGGHLAQLQAAVDIICTDTTRKKKRTNILQDVALNAMAPVEKGCKITNIFLNL